MTENQHRGCIYHSIPGEIDVPQNPEATAAEARFHRARIYVADNDVEGVARILDELEAYRRAYPTPSKEI